MKASLPMTLPPGILVASLLIGSVARWKELRIRDPRSQHLSHYTSSANHYRPFHVCSLLGLLLWNQIPQREVVNNVLDLFDLRLRLALVVFLRDVDPYTVFDTVASAPQRVILQVEDLEAGVYILDELADL